MSNFKAEIVSLKGIDHLKLRHNPDSAQGQLMTITPDKAKIMIDVLQEYLNNHK